MLTSKDVLERTGISRATLNNYIGTGLLPRPDVLPPSPDDGAAPRIGYFPDDTVERIAEIQRLKREGWTIARIAARFAGSQGDIAAGPAAASVRPEPLAGGLPEVSLLEIPHPAWLLEDGFGLTWLNEAARHDPQSPLRGLAAGPGRADVVERLLDWAPVGRDGSDAVLGFHLGLARQQGIPLAHIIEGLPANQQQRLHALDRASAHVAADPVAQLRLAAAGGMVIVLHAVRFREGILFVAVPGAGEAGPPVQPVVARPAPAGARMPAPALASVAVLVTGLQDAHRLWLQLPAREYFELVNEIWTELDAIFRRHGGRHARHPGEGMVCHFLPQRDAGHLWNALAAAHETREAMRALSTRWQARKGWDLQLCMNTGIDEGREWMGPLRLAEPVELVVLGDAADHAQQLSGLARGGAIWVTRSLVDKLTPAERERIAYGVPRPDDGAQSRLLSSFSRLADLAVRDAASPAVPPGIADLSVTELVDLAAPAAPQAAA